MVSMRFGALSPKKHSKPATRDISPPEDDPNQVSPELLPIVTLISAQAHRRYHEGIFMLYYDLNGDGKAADRKWHEVYGILTGNQLAYWDAGNLAKFKDSPEKLLETSSKPNYLNFTDAMFNAMATLPAAKQLLENVIIVLTTLKNRYIIQLRSYDSLKDWYLALRLATFEYQLLQEAYTGALLSARGLRLSDIKTILAEKRFNHEDWVKIRYGSGMAWRRCYAVIEPSTVRKKQFIPGRMLLYESDNVKKKNVIGVITDATLVTAVYPQLHFFIDKSTIMKLEGSINFKLPSVKRTKKSEADSLETSLFIMPEQHLSVPGFDTLIRFLIPLFDSFGLYGRPKRLKADRIDPDSLVFGLPTLPHVHYLNVDDALNLVALQQYLSWDQGVWRENFKKILRQKLAQGYDGCGSSRGFSGAVSSLSSPRIGSPMSSRVASSTVQPEQAQLRLVSGPLPKLSEPLHPNGSTQRVALAGVQTPRKPEAANAYGMQESMSGSSGFSGSSGGAGAGGMAGGMAGGIAGASRPSGLAAAAPINASDNYRSQSPQKHGRNVNNLAISTDEQTRKSVQLADIYHKYLKIQTPSDRFDDRNKILNGSAEEIDENVLPSLIRKKSLMHGGIYPSSEKHLIESSESEAGEDDEDEESGDSIYKPEGPLNSGGTGALKVPQYENRNLSYSSVQSPLTQYSEFNKQFSEAVEHPNRPDMRTARYEEDESDDESGESEYSDLQSPPPVPSHGMYPRSPEKLPERPAKQLPQIQQLLLLHAAQPLQKSHGGQVYLAQPEYPSGSLSGQMYQQKQQSHVQKSQATTNLALALNNGPQMKADTNKPRYISSPNSLQNQLPRFDLRPPPQVAVTAPQASNQPKQYQARQDGRQEGRPEVDYGAKRESPTVAPTSAFRVQPHSGQYRQGQPQGQPQGQSQKPPQGQPQGHSQGQNYLSHQQQGQSRHPYAQRVDGRQQQQQQQQQQPAYGNGQYQRPQQSQQQPQGSYQPQQLQGSYQPQQQQQAQHQPHQHQAQHQAQQNQPQGRPAQSNLRSYDSSQQMYLIQVQPNFQRQQFPQGQVQPPQPQGYGQQSQQSQNGQYQQFNQLYQPRQGQGQSQGQGQDPRYVQNPNQGYMRKY